MFRRKSYLEKEYLKLAKFYRKMAKEFLRRARTYSGSSPNNERIALENMHRSILNAEMYSRRADEEAANATA